MRRASGVGDSVRVPFCLSEVVGTEEHPFWVIEGESLESRPHGNHGRDECPGNTPGRWVAMAGLRIGDVVLAREGKTSRVAAVESRTEAATVYNFEVAGLHSYAVGSAGILVHNANQYDAAAKAGANMRPRNPSTPRPHADAAPPHAEITRPSGLVASPNGLEAPSPSSARPTTDAVADATNRRRGLRVGEPSEGVIYRREAAHPNERIEAYQASAPGRRSAEDGSTEVPALVFNNPNNQGNARDFIRFDGIEGTTLIDRKINVTSKPKQRRDLRRMSNAISHNLGYTATIEVPSQSVLNRLNRLLESEGIGNISVRLVSE